MTTIPRGAKLTGTQTLVFEDHFNGKMRPEWKTNLWFPGVINNEKQAYVSDAVRFHPDRLIIDIKSEPTPTWWDARRIMPYKSGFIHTHESFSVTNGVMEAKVKIPKANGLWPAIWLIAEDKKILPKPLPEIDVIEILGMATKRVRMNYHDGSLDPSAHPHVYESVADLSSGYHIYTCRWDAQGVEYFLDGSWIGSYVGPTYPGPYHLCFNCAVGGWAGTPDPVINETMEIDYVRVWA